MKRNGNAVKHHLPPDPNAQCEMEIARRRTLHHLHDSGRILSEALHFAPSMKARKALTEIVGQIQTLERRLADLKEAL
jgi:hypothetical protein